MTMTTEELQRMVDAHFGRRAYGMRGFTRLELIAPDLVREVIALRAERDRLREALVYLTDCCELASDHDWPEGKDPLSTARAALSASSDKKGESA
ncbi:hypothetical protein JF540_22855 [Salipiger thiooxidans]|uniref:hypothetical protein n=1 Tax=Salipiger thiooxidans TaxID=282683 RepID=UPI001A8F03CD|nr:hypothetical protein [Salipiger thiooxidans]MBN8189530.1 hypothetical protein [Salipiger thiooxidans]